MKETDALPDGKRANLRIITQNRLALNQITAVLPDESKVIMSSLRQFSGTVRCTHWLMTACLPIIRAA
nr:maltose transport inner membrane protein [Salmonella sp. NCTC 7297]